jgi:TolB-like protein/predicted Ser/Thr protein kinase
VTSDDFVGREFAHYQVLERIGAGGMGVVYLAHDQQLDRDVVLKFLTEETIREDDARARLLDEARNAAALNHPNICTIHEVGEANGRVYFAMERVEGRPLNEFLGPTGMRVETALSLAVQIADAVAHAHDRGIVHRDLKSANVIVTPDGRAKVLDFGIARRVDPVSQMTRPGTATPATGAARFAGTASCMPPEVYRGESADARGDVWALGILMHEMLTGQLPFRGGTEYELGAAILNAEPANLPESIPASLRSIVYRCLSKDPTSRFQRASELRAVLEMARSTPAGASAAAADASSVAAAGRGGDRGRQLKMIAAVTVVAGVLVAAGMLIRDWRPAGVGRIRAIAVLPLDNLSHDPEQDYFADGMTEELITSLANLENVRVISRNSVLRYRNTTKSIPEIARELNVDAVIAGATLLASGRVRINAQLIQAATDRHLWARSYERDLRDVLALQGEVAAAISAEIRTALNPRGRERAAHAPRVDPVAYEEYLKGRHEWGKRTKESLILAMAHFERAIAVDPGYAPAWAGLADVHTISHGYLRLRPREVFPKALAAAREALRLDPNLAQAHATLALLKYEYEHDWAAADSAFQRALSLNPSYATAHQWYGVYLARAGRMTEGLSELDRALRLDPASPVIAGNRVVVLSWQRRADEALAAANQCVERYPGFARVRALRGYLYLARKMYPEALSDLAAADSLDGEEVHRDARVRAALLAKDEPGYWRRVLEIREREARDHYIGPGMFVTAYAQLGDRNRAFDWLVKGLEDGDPYALFALRDPMIDPLRADPRFGAILQRYGLTP